MSRPPHFLAPLLEPKPERYVVRNQRTGAILASQVETAFDSGARRRGLLGRRGLAPDAVLIIAPCNGVHTFFMKFSIDAVFIDRAGRVLKRYSDLHPWRIGLAIRAFAVLEFAAGAVNRADLRVGDPLVLDRQSPPAR